VALALSACPGTVPPPGDEQMGSFEFRAELDAGPDAGPPDAGDPDAGVGEPELCPFGEIPDAGFSFTAAFSRFRDAGLYYVTMGGIPHDATFDGQRFVATYSAQRNFTLCSLCPGFDAGIPPIITMTETLSVTLVSKSQSDAVGGCVDLPPVDPDAGITLPGTTAEGGFDAVRACGALSERVTIDPPVTNATADDAGCRLACNRCRIGYTLFGDRR
jgi:hypothetical protein